MKRPASRWFEVTTELIVRQRFTRLRHGERHASQIADITTRVVGRPLLSSRRQHRFARPDW